MCRRSPPHPGLNLRRKRSRPFQASGYKVIVNKVGTVPLAQCTVTAARPGRQITQLVGSGRDKVTKVLYTTVYVDVKC